MSPWAVRNLTLPIFCTERAIAWSSAPPAAVVWRRSLAATECSECLPPYRRFLTSHMVSISTIHAHVLNHYEQRSYRYVYGIEPEPPWCRCAECRTQCCWLCGQKLPAGNPYLHFTSNGCASVGGSQPVQGGGVPAGAWVGLPGEQVRPAAGQRVVVGHGPLVAAAAAELPAAANDAARRLPAINEPNPLGMPGNLPPGREGDRARQPADRAKQLAGLLVPYAFQHPHEAMLAILRRRKAPAQAHVPAGHPPGRQPVLKTAAAAALPDQHERVASMHQQVLAAAQMQAQAHAQAHPAQPVRQTRMGPVPAQQPAGRLPACRYLPVRPHADLTEVERLAFNEAVHEFNVLTVANRAAPAPAAQADAGRHRHVSPAWLSISSRHIPTVWPKHDNNAGGLDVHSKTACNLAQSERFCQITVPEGMV
jgi:hypothetical protein